MIVITPLSIIGDVATFKGITKRTVAYPSENVKLFRKKRASRLSKFHRSLGYFENTTQCHRPALGCCRPYLFVLFLRNPNDYGSGANLISVCFYLARCFADFKRPGPPKFPVSKDHHLIGHQSAVGNRTTHVCRPHDRSRTPQSIERTAGIAHVHYSVDHGRGAIDVRPQSGKPILPLSLSQNRG
jgi:hypothetical protein